jgi:glycosyltransferase involved in cell wall biosynthesis
MQGSDWIVIPSIWWENSPIVIQEARLAGRPIIYSDIGGMSEKADPELDLPFCAGSPGALGDVIRLLVEGAYQADMEALSAHARSRLACDTENFNRHLALYARDASVIERLGQLAG